MFPAAAQNLHKLQMSAGTSHLKHYDKWMASWVHEYTESGNKQMSARKMIVHVCRVGVECLVASLHRTYWLWSCSRFVHTTSTVDGSEDSGIHWFKAKKDNLVKQEHSSLNHNSLYWRSQIIETYSCRVATVLENPGKSWNWGKKFPGPGKSLNLGHGPWKSWNRQKISLFPKIIKICC